MGLRKAYLHLLLFPIALLCAAIDSLWNVPSVGIAGLSFAGLAFLYPLLITARPFLTHHWRGILLGVSLAGVLQPWLVSPAFPALGIALSLPLLFQRSRLWRGLATLPLGLGAADLLGVPVASQAGPYVAIAVGGLAALSLLLLLFSVATLFPKVGILLTLLGVLGAAGVGVLNALPPSLQFNGLMVVYLVAFILATTLVASLVTFLFVKSLEYLSVSPLASLTWAMPMLIGPVYFLLRYFSSAPLTASLSWCTRATASISGIALLTWGLLAAITLLARRLAYRQLVADIAWKFLRSQRQVHTLRTKVVLALRELVPADSGATWPALAASCLFPILFAAASIPLSRSLTSDLDYQALVQAAALALAATYVLIKTFGKTQWLKGLLLALTAIALSAVLAIRLYFSPLTLRPAFLWTAVSLAAFPALLLAARGAVRLYLGFRGARLPRALDPKYAPPIVTRIAQGVGPSIFVSLVGVAVGVWALILVLSVMSGFSSELQERIVKAKDHVMVKTLPGTDRLDHPFSLANEIAALPYVAHASPYVEGEAMMSGAVNVSPTVTVRGIDHRNGGLTFLRQMLVAGDPDFLVHPETLVPFPGMQNLLPGLDLPLPSPMPDTDPESNTTAPTNSGPGNTAHQAPDAAAQGAEEDEEEDLPMAPIPGQPSSPDKPQPPAAVPAIDSPDDSPPSGLVPTVDGLVAMPDPGGDEAEPSDLAPSDFTTTDRGDYQLLPAVFIGRELARALGATPGTVIQMISPDGDVGPLGVQPRVRPFRVAGIFQTGMYEYDLKTAFTLMSEAQRFFNLGSDIDHIDVRLSDTSAATDVAQGVRRLLQDQNAEVLTWEEMNKNLFSALKLEQMMMFIVLGFIIIIASFNIISSLILIIRRRVSAIAILKTMGAGPNQIMQVFLLLGFSAGLFGTFSGVLLGLLSSGLVGDLGITLPREYYVRSIPVQITGWQVGAVALASMVVTGLAALYPGRLGSKVGIVEGLKDER